MAQVCNRLRGAFGGDDIVLPIRRTPDMRHGQQVFGELVFTHQRPVAVDVLGILQRAPAQLFHGLFHRVEGVCRAGQDAVFHHLMQAFWQGELFAIDAE